VREDDDCEHRCGRERGLGDKVNICEPLQDRQLKQAKGADIKPEPKW